MPENPATAAAAEVRALAEAAAEDEQAHWEQDPAYQALYNPLPLSMQPGWDPFTPGREMAWAEQAYQDDLVESLHPCCEHCTHEPLEHAGHGAACAWCEDEAAEPPC
jgi:hypothetical protein